jgi:hypothetical protein
MSHRNLSDNSKSKLLRAIEARSRPAKITNLGALAVVIVLVLGVFAGAYLFLPGASENVHSATQNLANVYGTSTSSGTSVASGCSNNQLKSLEVAYNSQSPSSPTLTLYTLNSQGQYTKTIDSPGSMTLGTINGPTTNGYTPPWVAVFNASAVYPTTVTATGDGQTVVNSIGQTVYTLSCKVPAGQSNNVAVWQQTGMVMSSVASGTTANTNIETVINSQTSQTNSFAATFPTAAPQSNNVYLQIFSNNAVGCLKSTLPGSTNTPLVDYGGYTNSVSGINEPTQSVTIKGGFADYSCWQVFVYNQTAIAFTAPGAVPIAANKVTGSVAYAVPVQGCAPAPSSGTGTTNPYICATTTYSVQEQIANTGKHIDQCIITADNTELGYIQQYFSDPALTAFPAAGNGHGFPTSFSGIVPPTASNAPHPTLEDYSCTISSY